jgi:hypothetical protein
VSAVTRAWLGFAALGTGMIHLALVISSPPPIAAVLAACGLAECAWGMLAFARERIAAPRAVLAGAMAPVVLWALLVAAAAAAGRSAIASSLGFTALAVATLLELFVAAVIAVQLRRGVDFRAPSRMPPAGRYLLGLMLGGLAVAALTTPALAATEAGRFAQPHGQHSDTFEPLPGGTGGVGSPGLAGHPGH